MNLKPLLCLILISLSSILTYGQEDDPVLTAPENWRLEIIPFPLEFAPEINFKGFEELRFAPGWSDSSAEDFWAYSFAWYFEKEAPMTVASLTENFNLYYDGLMAAVASGQTDKTHPETIDKTNCQFVKTDEGFRGKMRVYDAFFTTEYIELNIKAEESYCAETNKQLVLFHISPKSFDHKLWNIFEDVRIKEKYVCDD